jgi:hypothetical protein
MLELRAAATHYRLFGEPANGDPERAQAARRVEAKLLLQQIYDTFTEGFDSPDLREAAALLA